MKTRAPEALELDPDSLADSRCSSVGPPKLRKLRKEHNGPFTPSGPEIADNELVHARMQASVPPKPGWRMEEEG